MNYDEYDDGTTSTEQRDRTRGRGATMDSTPKWVGGIVIGSVILLVLIRSGFRGRAY